MTLSGLLYALGEMAINDRMVGFAGAGGSIYEINDLTIRDYPVLYVSPTGTHRAGENFTTYQLTLFYLDRLLEDSSNGVAIHSTAIEVLKNLIRKARQLEGVVEISEEYTITLFTETEKMKDRCNGAYAQADYTIVNDTTCAIYSADADSGSTDSGTSHFFRWVTENGAEIPYSATSYEAEWRTNYQTLGYKFTLNESEISKGWTDDIRMTLSFPENLTEDAQTYRLYIFEDPNDISTAISSLTWYQGAYVDSGSTSGGTTGNSFFYFVTEDYTSLAYNETTRRIIWRTDYEEINYELTQGGNLVSSGATSGTSAQEGTYLRNIPVNSTSGTIIYNFSAYDTGGTELGRIHLAQQPYVDTGGTYFRFTDASGNTLPPHTISGLTVYGLDNQTYTETGLTIYWDTDYTNLTFLHHVSYIMYDTGELHRNTTEHVYPSGNQYTFSYPENTGWFILEHQLDVRTTGGTVNDILGIYQWKQNTDKGASGDTGGTYFRFTDASGNTLPTFTDPITNLTVYGGDFLKSGDTITLRWASDYPSPLCAVLSRCYAEPEDPSTIVITDTSGTISLDSNGSRDFNAYVPHLHGYNYNYLDVYESIEAYHQNPNNPLGSYNWNVVLYTHFTDPNRTITGSPASNQIFYKTVGNVLRDTAMNTASFEDSNGNHLNIISNTYEGDYGIITCDGDIYYGQPFFPSTLIDPHGSGDTNLAVTEIIFPVGYGRLGSNGIWGVSDYYFKTVFIPEGVKYVEQTDLISNNIITLENIVLPSTLEGGVMGFISRNTMPNIYFNNTIARWKAISQPYTNYRIFPEGTTIHCLDGDYEQK